MKIVNGKLDVFTINDKDGNITPVKFKLHQDDKQSVIKIDWVDKVVKTNYAGNRMIEFWCRSNFGNKDKEYVLKYDVSPCLLSLWNI